MKLKSKGVIKNIVFVLLAVFLLALTVYFPKAVHAATTYSVTFDNNSGTSTAKGYAALNKKVVKNGTFTIPAVPKIAGYYGLGWTTTRCGTTPLYKPGTTIRVTKNMKFYVVRRKSRYFTMTYYLGNGTTNSAYKALQMKVEEGTYAYMPAVPLRAGYQNLGWTYVKNGTTVVWKEGARINPGRDWTFYAVQKSATTVTLYNTTGTRIYQVKAVTKGTKITLPGLTNASGLTMLGWSRTAGKTFNPEYEVGQTLTINSSVKLYSVVFNRNAEQNLSKSELTRWRTGVFKKYSKVIFVGDSRTEYMCNTLKKQFGTGVTDKIHFIASSGSGLGWLKSTGYTELMKLADKNCAIIFNHGVNDMGNVNAYVTYMKSLSAELKERGCSLFYMSVNPLNAKNMLAYYGKYFTEAQVRNFNSVIKSQLCSDGTYTYIDCYSYLIKNGFGFDHNIAGTDTGRDDGAHYTTKTYKRIFDYCLRNLYVLNSYS